MKLKRFFCLLLTLALLTASLALLSTSARADFGDFGGDSDYGGDSDSDYGNYGGYDSDSSYSYDSSDSGDASLLEILIGIVVFAAIGGGGLLFSGALRSLKRTGRAFKHLNSDSGSSGSARPQTSSARKPRSTGGTATPQERLTPIDDYRKLDPSFDPGALESKLSNLYVQMQQGWTAKDIASLRPYFSDAYFTQMQRQLDIHRKLGRTNYIDRIAVLDVTLRGYYVAGGEDHLIAEVRARIVDYTLDDKTGRLISGSQSAEKFMTYEYELTRTSGLKTSEAQGLHTITCPNCGAPLEINMTAKCPYCDSVVTDEQHSFVITRITALSQETK